MAKNMAIQTLKRAKSAEELQEHLKNMTDEDLQSFYDEAKKIPEDQAYKYEKQFEIVEEYMVERGLIKPQKVAPAPQSEMAKGAAVFNKARAAINSGKQLELTDDELELLRSYLERMHESLVDHTVENYIAEHFPTTETTNLSDAQEQDVAAQKSEATLQTQENQQVFNASSAQDERDVPYDEQMFFKNKEKFDRGEDLDLSVNDIYSVKTFIRRKHNNLPEDSDAFVARINSLGAQYISDYNEELVQWGMSSNVASIQRLLNYIKAFKEDVSEQDVDKLFQYIGEKIPQNEPSLEAKVIYSRLWDGSDDLTKLQELNEEDVALIREVVDYAELQYKDFDNPNNNPGNTPEEIQELKDDVQEIINALNSRIEELQPQEQQVSPKPLSRGEILEQQYMALYTSHQTDKLEFELEILSTDDLFSLHNQIVNSESKNRKQTSEQQKQRRQLRKLVDKEIVKNAGEILSSVNNRFIGLDYTKVDNVLLLQNVIKEYQSETTLTGINKHRQEKGLSDISLQIEYFEQQQEHNKQTKKQRKEGKQASIERFPEYRQWLFEKVLNDAEAVNSLGYKDLIDLIQNADKYGKNVQTGRREAIVLVMQVIAQERIKDTERQDPIVPYIRHLDKTLQRKVLQALRIEEGDMAHEVLFPSKSAQSEIAQETQEQQNVSTEPVAQEQEPENVSTEPEPVAQEPEPVAQEPEPVAQEPEPVAQEPEPVAQEPKPVAQEQEPVAQEQEPVAQEPEPVVQEPEPVVQEQEPVAQKFEYEDITKDNIYNLLFEEPETIKQALDAYTPESLVAFRTWIQEYIDDEHIDATAPQLETFYSIAVERIVKEPRFAEPDKLEDPEKAEIKAEIKILLETYSVDFNGKPLDSKSEYKGPYDSLMVAYGAQLSSDAPSAPTPEVQITGEDKESYQALSTMAKDAFDSLSNDRDDLNKRINNLDRFFDNVEITHDEEWRRVGTIAGVRIWDSYTADDLKANVHEMASQQAVLEVLQEYTPDGNSTYISQADGQLIFASDMREIMREKVLDHMEAQTKGLISAQMQKEFADEMLADIRAQYTADNIPTEEQLQQELQQQIQAKTEDLFNETTDDLTAGFWGRIKDRLSLAADEEDDDEETIIRNRRLTISDSIAFSTIKATSDQNAEDIKQVQQATPKDSKLSALVALLAQRNKDSDKKLAKNHEVLNAIYASAKGFLLSAGVAKLSVITGQPWIMSAYIGYNSAKAINGLYKEYKQYNKVTNKNFGQFWRENPVRVTTTLASPVLTAFGFSEARIANAAAAGITSALSEWKKGNKGVAIVRGLSAFAGVMVGMHGANAQENSATSENTESNLANHNITPKVQTQDVANTEIYTQNINTSDETTSSLSSENVSTDTSVTEQTSTAQNDTSQKVEQQTVQNAETAQEEAARQAQEEAARQAQEEAARQAQEEAAEEAARQAQEEAARQAQEEAARQAQEEAARQAQEEAARQAQEEAAKPFNIENTIDKETHQPIQTITMQTDNGFSGTDYATDKSELRSWMIYLDEQGVRHGTITDSSGTHEMTEDQFTERMLQTFNLRSADDSAMEAQTHTSALINQVMEAPHVVENTHIQLGENTVHLSFPDGKDSSFSFTLKDGQAHFYETTNGTSQEIDLARASQLEEHLAKEMEQIKDRDQYNQIVKILNQSMAVKAFENTENLSFYAQEWAKDADLSIQKSYIADDMSRITTVSDQGIMVIEKDGSVTYAKYDSLAQGDIKFVTIDADGTQHPIHSQMPKAQEFIRQSEVYFAKAGLMNSEFAHAAHFDNSSTSVEAEKINADNVSVATPPKELYASALSNAIEFGLEDAQTITVSDGPEKGYLVSKAENGWQVMKPDGNSVVLVKDENGAWKGSFVSSQGDVKDMSPKEVTNYRASAEGTFKSFHKVDARGRP